MEKEIIAVRVSTIAPELSRLCPTTAVRIRQDAMRKMITRHGLPEGVEALIYRGEVFTNIPLEDLRLQDTTEGGI